MLITRECLIEKVVELVTQVTNSSKIDAASSLGRPFEWDSLKHVQIILMVEERFSIKVGPEQIVDLVTIPSIVDFLESKKMELHAD